METSAAEKANQKGVTHLNFAENNLVPQTMLDITAFETRLLGADCHLKHTGLDATGLASAVVDLVKDAIEEAGNGGEDCGHEFLKVFCELHYITTKEADGRSSMEKGNLYTSQAEHPAKQAAYAAKQRTCWSHLNASLEHVRQRQIRNVDIVIVESDAGTNSAGGISHDVAVAEHCTFGVAGRSTREADGGKHVGLRRAYGSGALGAGGLNFIKRHDGEVGVRLFDGFVNGSHHDDILEGATDDRESDLELGRAAHNGSEPGVLDDVLHSVVSEGIV